MSIKTELKTFFRSFFRLIALIAKRLYAFVMKLLESKPAPPTSPKTENAAISRCKTVRKGSYVACEVCDFKEFA